jgi:transposase
MNKKNRRKKYTEEFKLDAVKLVTEQGYSGNEVAKRLGVNSSNVNRWIREYRDQQEATTKSNPNRADMAAELKQLRKENKRLLMEREILKKAAAFFAKESS